MAHPQYTHIHTGKKRAINLFPYQESWKDENNTAEQVNASSMGLFLGKKMLPFQQNVGHLPDTGKR